MTRYNIAYRHENGEVEGFSGFAFMGEPEAEKDAIRHARRKCEDIGQTFDLSRLIRSPKELTRAELETVKADWATY